INCVMMLSKYLSVSYLSCNIGAGLRCRCWVCTFYNSFGGLSFRTINELRHGGLEQVYIRGKNGYVFLTSVGNEAVLTALAREGAKLGLIFLEMRRAAEDLVRTIG
ncbi:MAG: roadblock/LC7 domain-containing protein, partial [Anaerolineales bacterium]|nr:roadblock/LC7 domain-containing protein [Anaerolineales bacterium]